MANGPGASDVVVLGGGPTFMAGERPSVVIGGTPPQWDPKSEQAKLNAERRRPIILRVAAVLDETRGLLDPTHDIIWANKLRQFLTTSEY